MIIAKITTAANTITKITKLVSNPPLTDSCGVLIESLSITHTPFFSNVPRPHVEEVGSVVYAIVYSTGVIDFSSIIGSVGISFISSIISGVIFTVGSDTMLVSGKTVLI